MERRDFRFLLARVIKLLLVVEPIVQTKPEQCIKWIKEGKPLCKIWGKVPESQSLISGLSAHEVPKEHH